MSDPEAPQGPQPDAGDRVPGKALSAPPAGATEPQAPPHGDQPNPAEDGASEEDASDNAFWLASPGYQIVQRTQAAERQRAAVLAAARAERPDLPAETFAILVDRGFPLSVPFEATPEDVLAYLAAFHPTSAPTIPPSWRRLRLEQALERLRGAGNVAPTQAEIAEAIAPDIAERTLRGWLGAEPELRALLPERRRRRGELPEPRRFST